MELRASILIVEDTLSLLRLYSHVLRREGYQVLEATTGAEAMQILREQRPEIVLLDRVLPDMDGSEICQLIKAHPPLSVTYVIMLSGLKTTEDDRVSGLEAGADDYVVKPVGKRELLARIKVAVRLKNTQLALQESEAKFRTLNENSPDIIGRFDRQFRFLYVNPATEATLGLPQPAFLGKTTVELGFPRELVTKWHTAFEQVFVTGHEQRIDFEYPASHGVRTFDTRLVPEFDANGTVSSILAVARDFTEHVRAEQEIARLAAVIEQAAESILIANFSGTILYANAAYERLTDHPAAEIIGRSFSDFQDIFPEDDFFDRFSQALDRNDHWEGITYCLRNDGSQRDLEAAIFPITDKTGRVINFAAIMRDVTERRRSEREREVILAVASALRKTNLRDEMLPRILDQTMALLHVVGAAVTTTVGQADDSVVVEMARGELAPLNGRYLPPDHTMAIDLAAWSTPYINYENGAFVVPNTEGKSTVRARVMAGIPLIEEHRGVGALWITSETPVTEEAMGMLLAIGDIAASSLHRAALYEEIQRYAADLELRVAERTRELAEANEKLRELDILKSKFVSNVSHELRTPISNLKVYLSLLKRDGDEKRSHNEAMLSYSVERLGQLVEDILNLSRLEIAHYRPREFEPTDLNAVIGQIVTYAPTPSRGGWYRTHF